MPLQNRVTPRGELIRAGARGTLMGNRGRLHDAARRIVRRQAPGYRAWVTCLLAFKGRRRRVMAPGRYTELFFLDEATALAAGHRPCGECRRPDYRRFRAAWLAGNADRRIPPDTTIGAIDRELHRDRLQADGRPRVFRAALGALPDGVFVTLPDEPGPLLLHDGALRRWTPAGYRAPRRRPGPGTRVTVLTPRSTVRAIAAGYAAGIHPSAERRRRAAAPRTFASRRRTPVVG